MKVCLKAVLLSIICLSFSYACFPMEHGELSDTVITKRLPIDGPVSSVQLFFGTLKITQIVGEEKEMLVVKTHENIYPSLQINLNREGCLSLGFEDGTVIQSEIILEYELKVKSLTAVKILGCGNVSCDAGFRAESLTVVIIGDGNFKTQDLMVGHLHITISGNGKVSITNLSACAELHETISGNGSISFGGGMAEKQTITISGNGSVNSPRLVGGTVGEVYISGFGLATVNIDGRLHVVTGAGGSAIRSVVIGSWGIFVNGRQVG